MTGGVGTVRQAGAAFLAAAFLLSAGPALAGTEPGADAPVPGESGKPRVNIIAIPAPPPGGVPPDEETLLRRMKPEHRVYAGFDPVDLFREACLDLAPAFRGTREMFVAHGFAAPSVPGPAYRGPDGSAYANLSLSDGSTICFVVIEAHLRWRLFEDRFLRAGETFIGSRNGVTTCVDRRKSVCWEWNDAHSTGGLHVLDMGNKLVLSLVMRPKDAAGP